VSKSAFVSGPHSSRTGANHGRLYTTIIRYDPVYYVHFKCNFGLSE
jgi:glutathionyl-hydroquinone reductase